MEQGRRSRLAWLLLRPKQHTAMLLDTCPLPATAQDCVATWSDHLSLRHTDRWRQLLVRQSRPTKQEQNSTVAIFSQCHAWHSTLRQRTGHAWRPTFSFMDFCPGAPVVLAFTPGPALLGGILLGIAAAGKLLLTGRILGVSGIFK
jgi:hypothetical protein